MTLGSMGSLNLGRDDVDPLAGDNRALLRDRIAVERIVTLRQVHSNRVVIVDAASLTNLDDPEADSMVTRMSDVGLAIRVADCVPVLLADQQAGVLGAAHAGRAGMQSGVVGNTVDRMRELGADRIIAWVGPHICGGCYEVPEQMAADVARTHPGAASRTRWHTPSVDLAAGVAADLQDAGATATWLNPCTFEVAALHSHRRDGAGAGRLAGVIWRVSPRG